VNPFFFKSGFPTRANGALVGSTTIFSLSTFRTLPLVLQDNYFLLPAREGEAYPLERSSENVFRENIPLSES
jgi:hypothetical protein